MDESVTRDDLPVVEMTDDCNAIDEWLDGVAVDLTEDSKDATDESEFNEETCDD